MSFLGFIGKLFVKDKYLVDNTTQQIVNETCNSSQIKVGKCLRCGKYTNLNSENYCKDCAVLKQTIENITDLTQKGDRSQQLTDNYNFVKKMSDYDFNIENIEEELERIENTSANVFSELSIDKFIEQLKIEIQKAGYNLEKLEYDQLKDGTYNFTYNECQIGRIKFGKKSSSMQILTLDFVDSLKNETMETYLSNISKWIEYIKIIEK